MRTLLLSISLVLVTSCGTRRDATQPAGAALFQVRVCEGALQAPAGEVFRILVEPPAQVQEAADLLGSGKTVIVAGALAAGDGGFNAPWSWHLEPTTVSFPEVAAEVCGGCPSFVQSDLAYWLALGKFCPIGRVIARDS